ncbi:COG4223 family protein [Thalassospira lucentensis]|uniref:COG4223 family protein n=1 Tax=Thalassospira lucentensis TaxID=168935 RepID=UPI003AA7BF89
MKKPETPKPDASAKQVDTEKTTETISVDSSGNASANAKPDSKGGASSNAKTDAKPDTKSDAKVDATKSQTANTASQAASKPGEKTADKAGVKPSDASGAKASSASTAKPEIKPASAQRSSQSTDKTTKPSDKAPKSKGAGGKAIFIFVVIIIVAIAAGWLTRAFWWRDAEPVLSQYVPTVIMNEITPDGFKDDGTNTATNTPNQESTTDAQDSQNTSNSVPAPDEDATMAEQDDAMVNEPNSLSSSDDATDTADTDADASTLPDGSVVVDPDLTERLSRLEGTINALRDRLNDERGGTVNDTVARRMAEIETHSAPIEELARVESELAGVANEMRQMSARLSTMEEEVRATAGLRVESRGQAIAMAVTILRDALQRGGPFIIALNQLERSSGDDEVITKQLETLKPLAEQGAPTLEKLRQTFPAMAQEAVQAATDDHSGSVWDATWANIKKMIPIRRVDVAGEESLEGRLATAENALAHDDLDEAVTALEGIEGKNASAAVSEWLNQAKNRQVLNSAIASLSAHAIGLLTGSEDSQ